MSYYDIWIWLLHYGQNQVQKWQKSDTFFTKSSFEYCKINKKQNKFISVDFSYTKNLNLPCF